VPRDRLTKHFQCLNIGHILNIDQGCNNRETGGPMKKQTFMLLAILLCALQGGAALAADPVTLTLPYSFKTTQHKGDTFTYTFSLLDSDGTQVWTESKPYKVPADRNLTHNLGSIIRFDLAATGPVDFSQQLTVEVRSGAFVQRSALGVVPYALWCANSSNGSADSANFWKLAGNDVDPLSRFLGTTNNAALQFKVNNAGALYIDPFDGSSEDSSPNLVAGFNAGGSGALGNASASGVVGAVIAGGGRRSGGIDEFNAVTDSYGVVGGGAGNVAGDGDVAGDTNSATFASVAGGRLNAARGKFGFVGGGLGNTANGKYQTIAGGWGNAACRDRSVIAGGMNNMAGGTSADIVGGYGNWAGANYSFIGGGEENVAGVYQELDPNPADAERVVDCSLLTDITTGIYSVIGGGLSNVAGGGYTGILGGRSNTTSGSYTAIGGGQGNIAAGDHASVPGGLGNTAAGTYSFAAGHLAKAWTTGSFVWADNSVGVGTFSFPPEDAGTPGSPIADAAENQFWVRATGGIYLITNVDPDTGVPTAGMRLVDGTIGWEDLAPLSDRNLKTAFAPVAAREVLEKVAALPIKTWSYQGTGGAKGPTHMGPMAQAFRATFDLGEDDKHIAPVDAAGVSLAAIQGLYAVVKELQATVASLESQLTAQREDSAALHLQVADLQKRYAQLRALVAVAPGINPELAKQ
jgi:hypothetical protein